MATPIKTWAGKWALVTGASAGIGWALAEELAAGGTNLVLTARRAERLEKLATELADKHKIQARVVVADLTKMQGADDIFAFTSNSKLTIDLLVNNAGFGAFGYAHEIPAATMAEMIQVNCTAVVQLTRLYLPQMVARRSGSILIVASLAGFQGVPFNSVYAATKGFDLLFAEGIAEEVRPSGVKVCALCPGPTTTEFQQVANQPDRAFRVAETAEKVARVGLEALVKGKSFVVSGGMNRFMMEAERIAPRRFVTRMAANMMKPEKH
ncbi:MAG TPA: SDR family oxidoreductase [Candidatus Acidoferrum sp.]|nr:SDR family oxidoreductase [Candidatus Acidoferrum sp.]